MFDISAEPWLNSINLPPPPHQRQKKSLVCMDGTPTSSSHVLSTERRAGKRRWVGRRQRDPHSPQLCHSRDTAADGLDFSSPWWHFAGIYVTVPPVHTAENLTLTWMFADKEASQIWFLGQPDDDADDDMRLHSRVPFFYSKGGRNARHRARPNHSTRTRSNYD